MTAAAAWTWQGLIVAGATIVALRTMSRSNAATRHVCAWAALVVVVCLPLIQIVLAAWDAPSAVASVTAQTGASVSATSLVVPVWPALIDAAMVAWMAIAAWGLARVIGGIRRMHALKASTFHVPDLQRRMKRWQRCSARGRRVEVRVSDACRVPCAMGLGAAYIVLPRVLAETLPAQELEAIVLHEHAHLARRDDWWRLLQLTIVACAWWHPAIRLLSRQIDIEREAACDDWVVRAMMPGRQYARCLLDVADRLRAGVRGAMLGGLVPSVLGSRHALRLRVTRLLDARMDHSRRVRWPSVAAGMSALACVWLCAARMTPVIAFERAVSDTRDATRESIVLLAQPAAAVSSTITDTRVAPTVVPRPRQGAPGATTHATDDGVRAPSSGEHGEAKEQAARTLPGVAAATPRLPGRAVTLAPTLAPDVQPVAIAPEPAEPASGPWGRAGAAGAAAGSHAGRAGAAMGRSMQRAGMSIGGFFSRAGRSVADSF